MKLSRRGFFSRVTGICSAVAAGALVKALPTSVLAEERRRARPSAAGSESAGSSGALSSPLVDPQSPTGKAVNYVNSHADLKDPKLKMERQGVKFENQFCSNCSFYKEVGKKEGSTVGTCTIFANQLVREKAWCASWNKKA